MRSNSFTWQCWNAGTRDEGQRDNTKSRVGNSRLCPPSLVPCTFVPLSLHYLRFAHRRRQLVQHAVDELVSVRSAVGLRELDGLVDGNAIGNLRPMGKLVRADQQHAALD